MILTRSITNCFNKFPKIFPIRMYSVLGPVKPSPRVSKWMLISQTPIAWSCLQNTTMPLYAFSVRITEPIRNSRFTAPINRTPFCNNSFAIGHFNQPIKLIMD